MIELRLTPTKQSTWLGFFDSPVGRLRVSGNNEGLYQLDFVQASMTTKQTQLNEVNHPIAAQIQHYLVNYFRQPSHTPTEPLICLLHNTTPFQQRVWQYLLDIPPGEKFAYGDCADTLKTAARAVGQALKSNPIPVIIPCHRIIAKTGIGGFGGAIAGEKIQCKQWLLQHEKSVWR